MNDPSGAMSEPLVTAVLVCWNHERFVRDAVLSALNQTYRRIQLIVIDNGSTDGSRRELEALRADHEFTLICQGNVGLVRALNQALALAEGKYLAALATDDVWLLDKTAKQVEFLESRPEIHLVSGQIACIDAQGQALELSVIVRPGDVSFADLMRYGCFVYGPTAMCRVQTLRDIGGWDETLRIEDYALALQLSHEGRRVHAMPDVLTQYRRHGDNWTAGSVDLDPEVAAIGQRYRHTPEYPLFYRRSFPNAFWQLVRDGRKREAIHVLLTEPVRWTWANVGRGLLRLPIPYRCIQAYRDMAGKRRNRDRLAR